MPPDVTTTAWAFNSNSPISTRELAVPRPRAARLEDPAADAVDDAAGRRQLVDAVAEPQRDQAAVDGVAHAPLERHHRPRARSPRDVEPWHRVPVADRPRSRPARPTRRSGTAGAPGRGATPASRPPRTPRTPPPTAAATGPPSGRTRRCPSSPAAPARVSRGCRSAAVPASQPGTGRRATRTLPAERSLRLLIHHDYPAPGVRQFRRRHQPGQPGPHDDDVGVGGHRLAFPGHVAAAHAWSAIAVTASSSSGRRVTASR